MSILKSTNSGLSTIPITVDTLYELGYVKVSVSEDENDTIFVNSKLPLILSSFIEFKSITLNIINVKLLLSNKNDLFIKLC